MRHAIYALLILAGLALAGMSAMASPPVEIDSVEALQRIGQDPAYPLNGYYVLTRDIEAVNTEHWNRGAGFMPIGPRLEDDDTSGFSGWFDGQGFVIRNLVIHRPEDHGVGLFGSIAGAGVVVNLGIEGGAITGGHYVGGLVGENWSQSVAGCYATAQVTGITRVGGLAGINRGFIDACYALGPVRGERFVGGLVGRNYEGVLQESFAAGPVTGYTPVGGLVGNAFEAEVIASFWDVTTSGLTISAGGWGEPTSALMIRDTYVAAGWDLNGYWTLVPGRSYPYFR